MTTAVGFGPYRLEAVIGRGGMGEIYRAFDTVKQRTVAVKRLPAYLAADEAFQARFRRECMVAAQLSEPHVIPIHDFGEIDGRLFLDMRFIEGFDLEAVLREHGALAPRRAVGVVSQIASALDAAHAAGLVHRDIKPSNVLLAGETGQEYVYVVDFGIAQAAGATSLTSTGTTVGTLEYMAPERFLSGHGDHRVDVYSLACVLYETLTGEPPFPGEGVPAQMYAHVQLAPPLPSTKRPDVTTALDAVVARGMAKDPDARFKSAGELAAAARAALDDESPPKRVVPVPGPPWVGLPPVAKPYREPRRHVPGAAPPYPPQPPHPPTPRPPGPHRSAPPNRRFGGVAMAWVVTVTIVTIVIIGIAVGRQTSTPGAQGPTTLPYTTTYPYNPPNANQPYWTTSVQPSTPVTTPYSAPPRTTTVSSTTEGWQSTGIELNAGQSFSITYSSGSWSVDYRNFGYVGPDGYSSDVDSTIYAPCKDYPEEPYGYLMGTVANDGQSSVFYVGSGGTWQAPASGTLKLKINDRCLEDNAGSVNMTVQPS